MTNRMRALVLEDEFRPPGPRRNLGVIGGLVTLIWDILKWIVEAIWWLLKAIWYSLVWLVQGIYYGSIWLFNWVKDEAVIPHIEAWKADPK